MNTANEQRLGRIKGLSNAEYHGGEGVSSTELKKLLQSYNHWKQYKLEQAEERAEAASGESKVRKAKDARDKGSLAHAIILEPHTVEPEFCPHPDKPEDMVSNATAAKAMLKEAGYDIKGLSKADDLYAAVHEHMPTVMTSAKWDTHLSQLASEKTILHPDDWRDGSAAAKAVLEHPVAGPLFTGGNAEESWYAIDPHTGLLRKSRTDYLSQCDETGKVIVTDLKTIRDAAGDKCHKEVGDRDYLMSASFYLDTIALVLGLPVDGETFRYFEWCWVFVETAAPYGVRILRASYDDLMLGRGMYERALSVYAEQKEAEAKGEKLWGGYDPEVAPLDIAPWRRRQMVAAANQLVTFDQ